MAYVGLLLVVVVNCVVLFFAAFLAVGGDGSSTGVKTVSGSRAICGLRRLLSQRWYCVFAAASHGQPLPLVRCPPPGPQAADTVGAGLLGFHVG